MATVEVGLRRGLPREPGGEPWPVVDGPVTVETDWVPPQPVSTPSVAAPSAPDAGSSEVTAQAATDPLMIKDPDTAPAAVAAAAGVGSADLSGTAVNTGSPVQLRRGLPRVAGGDPWPPAVEVVMTTPAPAGPPAATAASAATPESSVHDLVTSSGSAASPAGSHSGPARAGTSTRLENQRLRQGLPRREGGDPWPPVTEIQVAMEVEEPAQLADTEPSAQATPAAPAPAAAAAVERPRATSAPVAAKQSRAEVPAPPSESAVTDRPNPVKRLLAGLSGSLPGKFALAAVALVVVGALAVLASRWFLATGSGQSFLQAYPGEYHLPENAPVGFPTWLGWQHFLNLFLMVLIIRSGIMIRTEKRPTAYWTPRGRSDGKVSLTIFFHQSLDVLWLANGALFIVLLFASGQWMRVVPTSWEVFPNALSAGLQYMALDWPTDNGWVNYNSLQQLAYFTTIFVAAPLAAATGFRMSGLWPKKATRLSTAYPIEWARTIHFPVMIYFVAFITIHVLMVMSTGALRNLNHMYATQGSIDPTAYAANWTGFWLFVLSLGVIAGAVAVTRPFLVAQLAKLFGNVTSR